MTKMPLVSVLVPVYNIERYIGFCLESIIRQTYTALEIIVVDDGSTDRSGEICDLYAKKDARIKVIHKANGGLVSARKVAMAIATGEYIGYVDGDDWIGNGFYTALVAEIVHGNSDAVIAGFSRDLFDTKTFLTSAVSAGIYEGDSLECLFRNMISMGDFFRHGITTYLWNKLFRKEIIGKWQMAVDDRISIGEDAAVVYPTLLSCNKISVTDNCAYHYRQREDSMLKKSLSFSVEKEKLRILYEYMKRCIVAFPASYDLKKQLQRYILSTSIIRSGGLVDSERTCGTVYFPFGKSLKGLNIAICGAGTFGQQLERRLREFEHCNVVAWVDDDFWEYRRCCIDVDSIVELSKVSFDYVLIGVIDSVSSAKIQRQLIDIGVDMGKILKVSCPEDEDGLEGILEGYVGND